MAKLACEFADHIPEYREEYEEIAQNCRDFSVQLLDQCANTSEVHVILKESAGSSKYLRYSKHMKYPRLRLAIEHNHKEFVGHMFCQQTLRQAWHGHVPWQGSPLTFRLLHFLLQVLLAPFYALMVLVVSVGRDMHDILEMEEITDEHVNDKEGLHKIFYWFIHRSIKMKINLDCPLNRFLIFSGYYIIFVGLIVKTILDQTFNHHHGKHKMTFYIRIFKKIRCSK